MKLTKFDYFLVCAFIILVFVFILFFYLSKTEGILCTENPVQFGVSKFEESVKKPVVCECSVVDKGYSTLVITKNTSTWKTLGTAEDIKFFNLSLLDSVLKDP